MWLLPGTWKALCQVTGVSLASTGYGPWLRRAGTGSQGHLRSKTRVEVYKLALEAQMGLFLTASPDRQDCFLTVARRDWSLSGSALRLTLAHLVPGETVNVGLCGSLCRLKCSWATSGRVCSQHRSVLGSSGGLRLSVLSLGT